MPGPRPRSPGYAVRLAAALAATALLAGACSGDEATPEPVSSSPSSSDSQPASPTGDGTGSGDPASPAQSTDASAPPDGGPAGSPTPIEPGTDPLAWSAVPGPVDNTVTVGSGHTLSVDRANRRATLDGTLLPADRRTRIVAAFLDAEWAVVVMQDELEERPTTATVVDLATGRQSRLDASADVVPANGGSWAMGDGGLYYPTFGRGGGYCLAAHDLAAGTQEVQWCAGRREGFRGTTVSPAGVSVLAFDDKRPVSCRTVGVVADGELTAYAGATECTAWEGLSLPDGAVWTVLTREDRVEEGRVLARIGDGYYDLGPGLTGSLTWCDGAAYFAQDPQRQGAPARLLRWTPQGRLDVVYETPTPGEAIISEPRCGGDALTVTALTEAGDEQVTARLP